MVGLCPLVIALIFGLLPEVEALKNPPERGEIIFSGKRPDFTTKERRASKPQSNVSLWSMDWLQDKYEKLMTWDKNPWKIKFSDFGNHYQRLLESKNPVDIARAKELRRLADALHQRLLERYPELAVAAKHVPPDRNGFLKWLEFSERFSSKSQPKGLDFPEELKQHLSGEVPWDKASAQAWLDQHQPLMDEIRAIGLMPEQSIEGVDVHRWAFMPARLAKECSEALLLDARVAAENGDVAAALESIQASNGLATHLANVETPSLLAITVQILIQLQTQKYAFAEIMPALPPGQLDPAAWESALNPTVSPPGEFARIMKGEWSVIAREYLLPSLIDAEEPRSPPDPEAFLDAFAGHFLNVVQEHEGRAIPDWPNIPGSDLPDISHLSRRSQELFSMCFIGEHAWSKGMQRSLSIFAQSQAAFAIMKGQPIPNDPIYGQPYLWDPATRILSAPQTEAFKDLGIRPITVPKP